MATPKEIFQDGGRLRENAFYIEREADDLLYESLYNGEYCSILDPRQVGKSSLMERISKRLTEAGFKCGYVDLQSFANADLTFEKLIYSLIFTISRSLDIKNDNLAFLKEYSSLSANKVLEEFFKEVIFPRIDSRIALFVDEVDIVKTFQNLPANGQSDDSSNAVNSGPSSIGDSFFLTFRSLHERRTSEPFNRLSICFAGVAFPADLVSRPELSPFNVGKRIFLSDFTLDEVQGFRRGLTAIPVDTDELIGEVYRWTEGHPYMTQRLFYDLTKCDFSGRTVAQVVDDRVNKLFLQPNISPDANLAYAVKRLTSPFESDTTKNRRPQLLETFSRIKKAEGKRIPLEKNLTDTETPSYDESRLFGLTSMVHGADGDGNYLKVRNLIYDKFFSDEWVANAIDEQRDFRPFFERWQKHDKPDDYLLRGEALAATLVWAAGREDITTEEREFIDRSQEMERKHELTQEQAKRFRTFRIAAVLLAALLAAVGYLWYDADKQTTIAEQQTEEAVKQREVARQARTEAEEQAEIAQQKTVEAEEQAEIAQQKTVEAEKQTDLAKSERAKAEEQKRIAETQKTKAEEQTTIAQRERKNADDAKLEAQISANTAENLRQRAERSEAETYIAKKEGEIKSAITLRQERATQTQRYTSDQQSVFRNAAQDLATNSKLPANPLPKTFIGDWKKNTLIPDGSSETSDYSLNYAGEMMATEKGGGNYYFEGRKALLNWLMPESYYYRDREPPQDRQLIIRDASNERKAVTLPTISLSMGKFSSDGSFWTTRRKTIVRFDGDGNETSRFPIGEDFPTDSSVTNAYVSQNGPQKIALIVESRENFDLNIAYLALLDDKTQTIEKVVKGYYFISISDEIFLFEDENGVSTIDLRNAKTTPISGLSSGNARQDRRTIPFYNKKSQTLLLSTYSDSFGDSKGSVIIYDYLKHKRIMSNDPGAIDGIVIGYSPDDNYLFVYRREGGFGILNLKKNSGGTKSIKHSSVFKPESSEPMLVHDFSPDSKQLAVAQAGTYYVFDTQDLNESGKMPPHLSVTHGDQITGIGFYTAGSKSFIVSGDATGNIKISRLEGNSISVSQEFRFSSGIRNINVVGNDITISSNSVFSRITYENNKFTENTVNLNKRFITSPNLKFSPTFDTVAAYNGKEGYVWDSEGKPAEKTGVLDNNITIVEYSPTGQQVVFSTPYEAVLAKATGEKKPPPIKITSVPKKEDSQANTIKSVSFSGSGKRILVEFRSGYAIYDASSGKEITAQMFVGKVSPEEGTPPAVAYPFDFEQQPSYQFFQSETRFSPQENEGIVVVSIKLAEDESLWGILKEKFGQLLTGSKYSEKSLVKIIRYSDQKTLKEFTVDDFDYAKFSPTGNMVALFTKGQQCYIGTFDGSDEALLIPLEKVRTANFSSDGKQIVFWVDDTIYVYDTKDADLTHKTIVPKDPNSDNKWEFVAQKINYVKFVGESGDIQVGRRIEYREKIEIALNGTQTRALDNSNSNKKSNTKYVFSQTTAANSPDPATETFQDVGCYRINENGILVAISRCGQNE